MQIVHISELVYAEPRPKTSEERQAKHDAVLASLNTPMYLGRFTTIGRSDRYTVTSEVSKAKLTLKATDEVVQFIASHIEDPGYWVARMEGGTLTDVNLIQA